MMFIDSRGNAVERKYRDYFQPITAFQLAQSFPDEVKLAQARLRRIMSALSIYTDRVDEIMRSDMPDDQKYLRTIWVKTLLKLDPLCREANMLKQYLRLVKLMKPKQTTTVGQVQEEPLHIDAARAFPIQDLFSPEHPRETSNTISCCCPFHHETSPSFMIYKRTNNFYCFGCHAHGDAISFVMKQHNLDFKQAVRRLT